MLISELIPQSKTSLCSFIQFGHDRCIKVFFLMDFQALRIYPVHLIFLASDSSETSLSHFQRLCHPLPFLLPVQLGGSYLSPQISLFSRKRSFPLSSSLSRSLLHSPRIQPQLLLLFHLRLQCLLRFPDQLPHQFRHPLHLPFALLLRL